MKRFFIYLSVLASVAFGVSACVDQVFPKGTDPTPVVKASDIDITISDVKDSSFTATITPKAEGKYYSYLIVDSASMAGKKVDSMSVYKCSYDGLVVGCKESVKGASTTVKLEDLDPNSTYIVYAVNSSTEGNVSRLAQAKVKTSDTVPPFITKWSFEENEVTITYSEPVQWDKTKEISYSVYMKAYLTGSPLKSNVTDSVIVDGAEVTIVCKDAVHTGAAYNLNFPEGTFTDVVGNPCSALVSKFTKKFDFNAEDPDEEFFNCFPSTEGSICGVLDNGDLEYKIITSIPEAVLLKDFSNLKYTISIPNWISSMWNANAYFTVYNRTTESGSKVEEAVPMKYITHFCPNADYASMWFKPAGTAQHNDVFTIVIPAESIRDGWGDVNEEIEIGPITVIDPQLTFEDVEAGCNNVYATAKPNCDVYYYFGSCQNVQDSTDQDLIQNIKDEITYYAAQDQLTFAQEYEKYYACKGKYTGAVYNLNSETQYNGMFYGFFMTSDGTVMSDVFRQENTFTTAKFEVPTDTTGTYTYMISPFKSFGAVSGMPVSFNEDATKVTIKGYGLGVDLICDIDKSGNIMVPKTYTGYTHPTYGEIYTTEIYTWNNGSWSRTSYYNSLDKTIYFSIVNHLASGSYFGYGTETFCFDNSQPASNPSSVKSAVTNNVKLSKYIALPEKEMRRHAPRR